MMRRVLASPTRVLLLVTLLTLTAYGADTATSRRSTPARDLPLPGIVIVKLQPQTEQVIGYGPKTSARAFGLSALDAVLGQFNVQGIERTFPTKTEPPPQPLPDLSKIYTLHLDPGADEDLLVARLNRDPAVEYAERVYMAHTCVQPNDSLYYITSYQGQHVYLNDRVAAEAAWDIQQGDSAVVVAIIDTGVDWDHVDLAANIWVNADEIPDNGIDDDENDYVDDVRGWDFVDVPDYWTPPADGEDGYNPDNDPDDFDGHGTHCAGIASAVTDNSIGVAGTGWNTTVMPVRAGYLTSDGTGSIGWGYHGIVYAADNGADIISLSWGGGGASETGRDVIDYAWGLGAVIIAAAGNDGVTAHHYPSAYDHVVSVAATSTVSDNLALFSNYGTWVDICAPGTNILSTLPNNVYGGLGGTSMSAPMVAGAAALVKAQYPVYSNHEIAMQLAAGADNIDADNPDEAGLLGFGRLNIYQALTTADNLPPKLALSTAASDAEDGNADGVLDPGETIRLSVTLENRFLGGPGTNLALTLSTDDYAVSITNSQTVIGTIDPLGSATNTADPFVFAIEATSIPHRAVFTLDIIGDSYQETFTFGEALGRAPILLVDDDDSGNNVEGYYFDSLDSLGMPFQYWSRLDQGTPGNTYLQQFGTLIWLCEWTFPALDEADRAAIGSFLGGGGNLFLSGQDIGWDLCDASGTEYLLNSASRSWYENNLHARYIADDATPGGQASIGVSGLAASPIGDGLVFDISQPGRDAENQYPSIIEPLAEAEAIFEYGAGGNAATLWSGSYNVVNFGFGFEAITDPETRLTVMDRTLKWLNDFSIAHTPLKDTENTTDLRLVDVKVETSGTGVDSLAIYWSLDGDVPFNIEPMIETQPGTFTAFTGYIPAQSAGTTVHYFIFALADNDFFQTSPAGAPHQIHIYDVGLDTEPPVIEQVTGPANTIDNSGYYPVEAQIRDNLGVDTSSVYLHYWTNGGASDSLRMGRDMDQGVFAGAIDFGAVLADGDTVRYYVSAHDSSSSALRTESAVEEFTIVSELLVDDFEAEITDWAYTGGWEKIAYAHSGTYSFTESPIGYYANDSEYTLERTVGYNLSTRESAYLTFWHIDIILAGDSALVEVSPDGSMWQVAKVFTDTDIKDYAWEQAVVSLSEYVGEDDVRFRFRLVTDGSAMADGWYLDDIVLYVDTTGLGVEPAGPRLPARYALKQNYPNPFNPTTVIEYHLPRTDEVTLDIYNLRGQLVKQLVAGNRPAGVHTVTFDAGGLASGVYFYRLQTAGFTRTRKMLILK